MDQRLQRLNRSAAASLLWLGAGSFLAEASASAMRMMADAGERTLQQGVGALRPLFETLPPQIRDVEIAALYAKHLRRPVGVEQSAACSTGVNGCGELEGGGCGSPS
jgi:hypothetical protein